MQIEKSPPAEVPKAALDRRCKTAFYKLWLHWEVKLRNITASE